MTSPSRYASKPPPGSMRLGRSTTQKGMLRAKGTFFRPTVVTLSLAAVIAAHAIGCSLMVAAQEPWPTSSAPGQDSRSTHQDSGEHGLDLSTARERIVELAEDDLLTPDEADSLKPHLSVKVTDGRDDKSVPLPPNQKGPP